MGRRPNLVPTEPIPVTLTPKLHWYLQQLVFEEGYGTTPNDVAARLIQEGLDALIKEDVVKRKRGAFKAPQGFGKRRKRRPPKPQASPPAARR